MTCEEEFEKEWVDALNPVLDEDGRGFSMCIPIYKEDNGHFLHLTFEAQYEEEGLPAVDFEELKAIMTIAVAKLGKATFPDDWTLDDSELTYE